MAAMVRRLCALTLVLLPHTVSKTTSTSTGNYFYNLDEDPNEENDLYDDSKYSTLKKTLQSRLQYWQELLIDPEVPDTTGAADAYADAGGYAPWLETDTKTLTIKQKYSANDPPNIVFILADDWGWNDAGWRSTSMPWTTPNIDRLVQESVLLENFYSHEICTPTRGALMTGRFALRLGQWDVNLGELPLSETTLAHELKSAGYRTYLVGKWDLGFSTKAHLPTNRGFDYFYGYLNGVIDYWNKQFEDILDLHENEFLVTNKEDTSSSLHAAYLFQNKAEAVIKNHAKSYPKTPMFLYYPTQLIHSPWDAPEWYLNRCELPSSKDVRSDDASLLQNYCALNIMFDEVIANLTCALNANGMGENTIMVIMSDNGGEKHVEGNTYPFKGHKGYYFRGGVSSTAIVSGAVLPKKVRGTTYNGHMHVTDWLPTLMSAATDGTWKGSYTGAEIDGLDFWPALTGTGDTPEKEIVFFVSENAGVIQQGGYKYFFNQDMQEQEPAQYVFEEDQGPKYARQTCSNPNLIGSDIDMTPKSDKDWEEGSDHSKKNDDDEDDKDKDEDEDEDEEEDKDENDDTSLVPPRPGPLPIRPVETTDDTPVVATPVVPTPPVPINVPPPHPSDPITPDTPAPPSTDMIDEVPTYVEEEKTENVFIPSEPENEEVEASKEEENEETESVADQEESSEETAKGDESESNTALPDVTPINAGVSLFTIFMSAGIVCLVMAALGIRILLLSDDSNNGIKSNKNLAFDKMTVSEVRRDNGSISSARRDDYQTISGNDDELDEEAKGGASYNSSDNNLSSLVEDEDKEFSLPSYQRLDDELSARS